MGKKKKMKEKDKRENKFMRIVKSLEVMQNGEGIKPTNLAKKVVGIHPDTLRDLLDLYDSLKEVGFEIIRDEEGKIMLIRKVDENLEIKKAIRDIKNNINDIKLKLEEIDNGKNKG